MTLTAGIDVGSSAVKAVVLRSEAGAHALLGKSRSRIRGRELREVIEATCEAALEEAHVERGAVDYVASTGEGEAVEFRTGHFYSMATHARGALFLEPEARAVLDVGALHGRVIRMDARGKVLDHRMTSQCASGSGQFLENIGRYLGVSLEEIGALSRRAEAPEVVSSICAVLAETDVINMVSRGIPAEDILNGVHHSVAGRLVKLLASVKAVSPLLVTGGLSLNQGLIQALRDQAKTTHQDLEIRTHPDAALAGALDLRGGERRLFSQRHGDLEEAALHEPDLHRRRLDLEGEPVHLEREGGTSDGTAQAQARPRFRFQAAELRSQQQREQHDDRSHDHDPDDHDDDLGDASRRLEANSACDFVAQSHKVWRGSPSLVTARTRSSRVRSRLRRLFLASAEGPALVAHAPPVPVREIVRRFWPYARPFRRYLWLALLLVALVPAIDTVQIWLFKVVVDEVLVPRDFGPFAWIAAAYVGLTALAGLVSFADDCVSTWIGERFVLSWDQQGRTPPISRLDGDQRVAEERSQKRGDFGWFS